MEVLSYRDFTVGKSHRKTLVIFLFMFIIACELYNGRFDGCLPKKKYK